MNREIEKLKFYAMIKDPVLRKHIQDDDHSAEMFVPKLVFWVFVISIPISAVLMMFGVR